MDFKPSENLWKKLSGKDLIPKNAVCGGYDFDNSPIYVGRAIHDKNYYICQIIRRHEFNFAVINHIGRSIEKNDFEILVENGKLYDWIPVVKNEIPKNAVSINDKKLYIGRGLYENNFQIGTIQPTLGCCYVLVNGKEHKLDKYEILVEKENYVDTNVGALENLVSDVKNIKMENDPETDKPEIGEDLTANTEVSINGVPKNIILNYEIGKKLGSGGFGDVYLVTNKSSGHKYAMKLINSKNEIKLEAQIMHKLKYIYLTHLYDFSKSGKHNAIIMEYMVGGNLIDLINTFKTKRLPINLAKLYFYQMCRGVNYLHENGYTHRDLKPANLLLATKAEKTLLKVTDFGLTKEEDLKTFCGTPGYMAPEVERNRGVNELIPYTQTVDIWSMGIILKRSLYGSLPKNQQGLDFLSEFWQNPELEQPKTLMMKMLTEDPKQRITTQGIIYEEKWFDCDQLKADIQQIRSFFE